MSTIAAMSAHQSFPKPASRLTDKHDQRVQNALAWRRCCAEVDRREGWKCRVCNRRVVKTLTLCPERAEHHHLVGRRLLPRALHCDPRVVVLTCAYCHWKLTRHELLVTAATCYQVEGRSYPDADGPLTFI
jgi:hypothetical protein